MAQGIYYIFLEKTFHFITRHLTANKKTDKFTQIQKIAQAKYFYMSYFNYKFVANRYSKPMLLSKKIAVELNIAGCKLKQYTAAMLKKQNVDLTPEQFLLIDLLWNQGPLSQQEIADQMQKDKNSITKLVDAIERKGFVKRNQNPNDRRSNTIVPTELAESLKDDAKSKGISILDKMLTGISEEELNSFLDTLDKLCANMSCDDE